MMYALHPGAKFFEDIRIGEIFVTPGRTLTETDITLFAGLSGDFHPLHTNQEYAKGTPFGGRIVHGPLTLVITFGLVISRLGIFEGTAQAFLGLNNLKFTAPVRAGDTIYATVEVTDARETKKGDRGIVAVKVKTLNQNEEVVVEGDWKLMMA